jgi:hypothetical protein
VTAATLDYDHLTQTARLGGPTRARFVLPPRRR